MTPRWFGRYRAVAEIGRGHLGTTYLAHADHSNAPVALKRLDTRLADDASFVQSFLEDIDRVSGIDSPFVARILESGKCTGTYFVATEYLHAEPLELTIERAPMPLPLEIACRVIASAADGVHAAHDLRDEEGAPSELVHRHLCPRNIFVGWDGSVKVVDFGVGKFGSKVLALKPGPDRVAYMAPEQVDGGELDRRTDVFALGVMLYELTTGRPLFVREHSSIPPQSAKKLLQIPPPEVDKPSSIIDGYPKALEEIVLRAVSRDPAERHATAYDLARDIEKHVLEDALAVEPSEIASFITPLFEEEIKRREMLLQKLGPRQSTPPPA